MGGAAAFGGCGVVRSGPAADARAETGETRLRRTGQGRDGRTADDPRAHARAAPRTRQDVDAHWDRVLDLTARRVAYGTAAGLVMGLLFARA